MVKWVGLHFGRFFHQLIRSPWLRTAQLNFWGHWRVCHYSATSVMVTAACTCFISREGQNQGDQIGRIFAYWVPVYFGWLSENYWSSANLLTTFYQSFSDVFVLTKTGLCYVHFGHFFTNSSGHPGQNGRNFYRFVSVQKATTFNN
jgi:hypothetical protein